MMTRRSLDKIIKDLDNREIHIWERDGNEKFIYTDEIINPYDTNGNKRNNQSMYRRKRDSDR